MARKHSSWLPRPMSSNAHNGLTRPLSRLTVAALVGSRWMDQSYRTLKNLNSWQLGIWAPWHLATPMPWKFLRNLWSAASNFTKFMWGLILLFLSSNWSSNSSSILLTPPAHLGGSGLSGPNELPLGSPQLPLTQRSPTPCFLVQTCSNWNRSPPLTVPKILGRSQKNGSFRRFQEFNGHYMVTLWGSWQLPLFLGENPCCVPAVHGPLAVESWLRVSIDAEGQSEQTGCGPCGTAVAQWIVELYPKIVTLSLDHGFSTN